MTYRNPHSNRDLALVAVAIVAVVFLGIVWGMR